VRGSHKCFSGKLDGMPGPRRFSQFPLGADAPDATRRFLPPDDEGAPAVHRRPDLSGVRAGREQAARAGCLDAGVERLSVDQLFPVAEECVRLGVPVLALFPVIDSSLKSNDGREAVNSEGLVPRAVRALKQRLPELGLLDGRGTGSVHDARQDGVTDASGYVLNDETVEILRRQALTQAQAGVDIVAPSDMMDGRIAAIRNALESNGHIYTRIMAYAAKYASAFTVRSATRSAPSRTWASRTRPTTRWTLPHGRGPVGSGSRSAGQARDM